MKQTLVIGIPLVLFIVVGIILSQQSDFVFSLTQYMETGGVFVYFVYVLMLVAAVVFMPLTVTPLIPVASSIMGPFVTGVLSVIGWTLGSMIAFLIARYVGKPFLEKFISFKKLDELSTMVPEKSQFMFIVLLRLTLPVDLISYALGLTKSLGFTKYSVATLVGVTWFSFSFAYLGDALIKGNLILFLKLLLASLVIFLLGWYLLRQSKNSK